MKVGALEAKNQFSALTERAAAGEEIIVTEPGEPYVKTVPVRRRHDPEEIKAAFRRMRAAALAEGIPVPD